jgi:hypothetical protein
MELYFTKTLDQRYFRSVNMDEALLDFLPGRKLSSFLVVEAVLTILDAEQCTGYISLAKHP